MPSLQSSKRKASVVSWKSAKKPRKKPFQDSWKKGRSWLYFDGEAMVCSFCKKHANLLTQCSFKRDAWISGCHRRRLEVVREYEQSKMHWDSESAEQTQCGVQQNPGGMFHVQLARRDDTAKFFMKILYWIIEENVALEKWNSFEGEKCL